MTYPFFLQSTESGAAGLLTVRYEEHPCLFRRVLFRPLYFKNSACVYQKSLKLAKLTTISWSFKFKFPVGYAYSFFNWGRGGGGKNHGCFLVLKVSISAKYLMQIFINICSLLFVIFRFTIDNTGISLTKILS